MNILTYLRLKYMPEEGATATEYVFLLAGIALLIVGAVYALGGALQGEFNAAEAELSGS